MLNFVLPDCSRSKFLINNSISPKKVFELLPRRICKFPYLDRLQNSQILNLCQNIFRSKHVWRLFLVWLKKFIFKISGKLICYLDAPNEMDITVVKFCHEFLHVFSKFNSSKFAIFFILFLLDNIRFPYVLNNFTF